MVESEKQQGPKAAFSLLTHSIRSWTSNLLELVALETRLAGYTLSAMVALGVIAGISGVSAWLFLLSALVAWVIVAGWGWAIAFIAAAALNLLILFSMILLIRRISKYLLFKSLRSVLQPVPTNDQDNKIHQPS